MSQILDLYAFLAVLLRGIDLALEAVTVGGVVFLVICLNDGSLLQQPCRSLLRYCSWFLMLGTLCSALLAAVILHSSAADFTWLDLMQSSFARSGLVVAGAAAGLAMMSTRSRPVWFIVPGVLLMTASLLASHAFARVDHRVSLLLFTALHRVATAAWIGGLPYLLIVLSRGDGETIGAVARRFSRLAAGAVALLLFAGLFLGRQYVGSVAAAYGTSYGVILGTKGILFGLLLLLGGSNFLLLRQRAAQGPSSWPRMRRVVEVEVAIGIAAILAAASLTSQPPAVDLVADRLSAGEIRARLTPRWPRLATPPLASLSPVTPLNLEESERFGAPVSYVPGSAYRESSPADIQWSEFNHNWAGICVLGMGVLATLAQTKRVRWARHWPLAFLGLAFFLLIRADAENWPLGPRGFWESFQVAEVAQHRFFVALIVLAAFFEWRVAVRRNSGKWSPLIFPIVCMTGGALLLTHNHPLGNIKEEFLAGLSHTFIALAAITAAAARWLELRLPKRLAPLGYIWAGCLVTIGLTLVFYRES